MENIITISRPELTADERARRMAQIKQAAIELIRAEERRKQEQAHGKEK